MSLLTEITFIMIDKYRGHDGIFLSCMAAYNANNILSRHSRARKSCHTKPWFFVYNLAYAVYSDMLTDVLFYILRYLDIF